MRRPQPAPKGPQKLNFPGKDGGLIVLGDKPLVAETPEQLLDDDTTPTSKFFIRNNGQIPEPTGGARRLEAHHRRRGQQAASRSRWASSRSASSPRPIAWCWSAAATAARTSRRRRAATSGPMAASAAPSGPGCRLPTCSGPPASRRRPSTPPTTAPTCTSPAIPSCATAVARRAAAQGDGPVQPAGVGHERQAAGEHPRRAAAPRHPGLAGLGLAQVAHQDHAARQGARRPRHDRHLLSRGHQADAARRQDGRRQLQDPGIDAGAQHRHQPGQRHAARRPAPRRSSCRGAAWAGDLEVKRVDVSIDFGATWQRPTSRRRRTATTGGAGPRRSPCRATAITRSGCGRPTPPTSPSRISPATGTRKATAPTRCIASPCWLDSPAAGALNPGADTWRSAPPAGSRSRSRG